MKYKIQTIITLLFFSSQIILGQTKDTRKADKLFEKLSYLKASKAYEKLSKKKETEYILKKLGDSYYEISNMQKASDAYSRLFKKFSPEDVEYYFKYAQTLRSIGDFEASDRWMDKFHKQKNKDARGKNFTDEKANLSKIKDAKGNYEIKNLRAINTVNSDFGVTEYGNSILFSSPEKRNFFVKRTDTKNEKPFLDIYQVQTDDIGSTKERGVFSDKINTKFHESSISFSPDQKTMYFTRNNFNKGDYRKDKRGVNKLKIYKAELIDNEWSNIEELPFCSNEYSVGHPSVSKDGKHLYFASDMPGSVGETDLYVVEIKEDNTYGVVQNLGININTEGREMFPFISDDDILYFSSDGHFGIGALDVFSSKKENGSFTTPENLKAPINSEMDDFSFSINSETKKGYLSSNRSGGVGDDDIYSVAALVEAPKEVEKEEEVVTYLEGIVIDALTKNPIAMSTVTLLNQTAGFTNEKMTSSDGRFKFSINELHDYKLNADKSLYNSKSLDHISVLEGDVLVLELIKEFTQDNNNKRFIEVDPIYFDFDKHYIRIEASKELDKVVAIMKKYPNMIVESGSHTDVRGSRRSNQLLSSRRAKATVAYIISKGIDPRRIRGKGYGETQIINGCIEGVACSEEEHEANRRTEFKILKM